MNVMNMMGPISLETIRKHGSIPGVSLAKTATDLSVVVDGSRASYVKHIPKGDVVFILRVLVTKSISNALYNSGDVISVMFLHDLDVCWFTQRARSPSGLKDFLVSIDE